MIDTLSRFSDRAAKLRTDFDRSFAVPLRADVAVKVDLLAIRVGSESCALRLSDVTGLFADRVITRIPGSNTALLGIAGFRGAVVPVYSLQTLLGHSGAQVPRWLVTAATPPIALAFDEFEGHLRVPTNAVLPQQTHTKMRTYAREFIRSADVVRSVLHLPSLIEALGTAEQQNAVAIKEHGVRGNEYV